MYFKSLLLTISLSMGMGMPMHAVSLSSWLPAWPKYEERWDWSKIEPGLYDPDFFNKLLLPPDFEFGVAASALQMEGRQTNGQDCINNWTELANKNGTKWPQAFHGNNHWERYKEDANLIKELGVNSYRLSVEWSKIQPEEGRFDEDVLAHYESLIDELIKAGIKPIICFFHHTWPMWFNAKGAFEKAENNKYFVAFAQKVFDRLNKKVSTWMSFNEPVCYVMGAYFWEKTCPPGKEWELRLTGVVLKNMLDCHIAIHEQFKKINPDCQVGLSKGTRPIHPYNPWNILESKASAYFNYLLCDVLYEYFNTGYYRWPGVKDKKGKIYYNPQAKFALDYIHLTYYTHTVLNIGLTYQGPVVREQEKGDVFPDKPKQAIYAEGLYEEIKHAHKALPEWVKIYVGENGIAEAGDQKRDRFIRMHLYAVSKAYRDGYPVHGYFYWAPMDTANWSGYFGATKYGLYKVDMKLNETRTAVTGTFNRTLRPSAKPFVNFMRSRKGMGEFPIELMG